MPNGFFERFRSLMGDMTARDFAAKCGDLAGESAIKKAAAGKDIAVNRLEEWAEGFGLKGVEAAQFIRQGLEAEALMDAKRGKLYAELLEELRRSRELDPLLRQLLVILQKEHQNLSKEARAVLRELAKLAT